MPHPPTIMSLPIPTMGLEKASPYHPLIISSVAKWERRTTSNHHWPRTSKAAKRPPFFIFTGNIFLRWLTSLNQVLFHIVIILTKKSPLLSMSSIIKKRFMLSWRQKGNFRPSWRTKGGCGVNLVLSQNRKDSSQRSYWKFYSLAFKLVSGGMRQDGERRFA